MLLPMVKAGELMVPVEEPWSVKVLTSFLGPWIAAVVQPEPKKVCIDILS